MCCSFQQTFAGEERLGDEPKECLLKEARSEGSKRFMRVIRETISL